MPLHDERAPNPSEHPAYADRHAHAQRRDAREPADSGARKRAEAKLSNEKFVANADEDVIAADRSLLAQSKVQLESLRDALTRFQ